MQLHFPGVNPNNAAKNERTKKLAPLWLPQVCPKWEKCWTSYLKSHKVYQVILTKLNWANLHNIHFHILKVENIKNLILSSCTQKIIKMAASNLEAIQFPPLTAPLVTEKFMQIILDLYRNLGVILSISLYLTKSHHCHLMSNFLSISISVLHLYNPCTPQNHFDHTPSDESTGNA